MRLFSILLTIAYLFTPTLGYCEELTPAKKEAMKELMQVSGEAQMAELNANYVARRLIKNLKNSKPNIDPKVIDIAKEECETVIHEEIVIKESYQPYFYHIYHKYFTFEEIKELIQFYKTPLGRRLVAIMPKMSDESIEASELWRQQILGPTFDQRVSSRFHKEGIKIDK